MRYLAIDLGNKRTGIAVGDSVTGLVSPVDVIDVPAHVAGGVALMDALLKAVEAHLGPPPLPPPARAASPGEIVVGFPLNMDDTEGPAAKAARAFAEHLAARAGRPVHLQDERLTSAAADWTMSQSGLTHKQKKGRRDALAAAAILRDFLDARR